MKDSDYIQIQGWMVTKEGLSGTELMCYAVIFSFSRLNGHDFHGTHQYLADWCGVSRRAVIDALNRLLEKDKITKEVEDINGMKRVHYAVKDFHWGCEESSHGGENSSHIDNIEYNNIIINKEIEKDKSFSTKKDVFSCSDFLSGLINAGVEESVARDWMSIRKAKKASNTATALKLVLNAFRTIKERYGISENDAITICVARGWYGCAASYFDNIKLEDYGIGTQTSLYTKNNGKEWQ